MSCSSSVVNSPVGPHLGLPAGCALTSPMNSTSCSASGLWTSLRTLPNGPARKSIYIAAATSLCSPDPRMSNSSRPRSRCKTPSAWSHGWSMPTRPADSHRCWIPRVCSRRRGRRTMATAPRSPWCSDMRPGRAVSVRPCAPVSRASVSPPPGVRSPVSRRATVTWPRAVLSTARVPGHPRLRPTSESSCPSRRTSGSCSSPSHCPSRSTWPSPSTMRRASTGIGRDRRSSRVFPARVSNRAGKPRVTLIFLSVLPSWPSNAPPDCLTWVYAAAGQGSTR